MKAYCHIQSDIVQPRWSSITILDITDGVLAQLKTNKARAIGVRAINVIYLFLQKEMNTTRTS